MEENKETNNQSGEQIKPALEKKPTSGMTIVGYNVLALVVYTTISGFTFGPYLDAFCLFWHVLICFIIAPATKKWSWALSGLIVLLIGFSTCVEILWKIQ
jgi:hypothetical protein